MKQFDTRSKTIEGNTFYVRPFPAFKAVNLTGELSAVIAPLLGALTPYIGTVVTSDKDGGLFDVDVEEAAPAIAGAFSSISGDKLESIMKKLLTTYGNIAVELADENEAQKLTEDLVNEIFCGDVQGMFVLAFEVIRANYNGFFRKLGDLSGRADMFKR